MRARRPLRLKPGVALPGQPVQLFILLAEPVSNAGLIPFAGSRGGLFDQLPDVVFQDPDPIVEFCRCQRTFFAHDARSGRFVGWAKRSVPTSLIPQLMVGTLRFAHPKAARL